MSAPPPVGSRWHVSDTSRIHAGAPSRLHISGALGSQGSPEPRPAGCPSGSALQENQYWATPPPVGAWLWNRRRSVGKKLKRPVLHDLKGPKFSTPPPTWTSIAATQSAPSRLVPASLLRHPIATPHARARLMMIAPAAQAAHRAAAIAASKPADVAAPAQPHALQRSGHGATSASMDGSARWAAHL
ncbi:hypothetical protein ACCO45_011780 [Purpureocillium lilacinum]|uniref:Uncharacterized protein n=1 Tax=Purpureocillium lilacinum TaxID=33203 RepID=A0ACC4DC02_PURLI